MTYLSETNSLSFEHFEPNFDNIYRVLSYCGAPRVV